MNKYNSKEAKVERKLLKVLARELAEATFKEAQSMVPKSSGNLEKTGSIDRIMNDGFVITYTAPYAYNIHEGKSEFKNLTSPHVSWVDGKTVGGTDGFWRKVPNKREPIKVKAHSKTWDNTKVSLQNDGSGDYIKIWTYDIAKPSDSQIA